ncbi:MAG: pyridoxal-phosphate dependent enzyme [Pseudomonadota bacterium]|nr:pyridoxal-phosphate dependent enzyme [Pseudomonadota bacterium]
MCDSILDTIGNTRLVRLSRLVEASDVHVKNLAKLGSSILPASVKDRIWLAMVEHLEREGCINPGTVIVELTSGNTGIALAFVAAAKGYRLILTMPESMSVERRRMLLFLGAELELTPAARGMRGAIERAEEIWADTGGRIDALVTSVGTGGTLTGCGALLKERNPNVRIVVVEPEDSQALSGGTPDRHMIEGIGAGFVPPIRDTNLIDEVIPIANGTAFRTARQTAALEGLPVSISTCAALAAAIEVAEREEMTGWRIVVIIPSFAERYLSTPLFDKL